MTVAGKLIRDLREVVDLSTVNTLRFFEDQHISLITDHKYIGIYSLVTDHNYNKNYGAAIDWKKDGITTIASVLQEILDILKEELSGSLEFDIRDNSLSLHLYKNELEN